MTTVSESQVGGSACMATATAGTPVAMSRLNSLWTLFWLTFRQHLHGRRWMAVALLFLLPGLLATLIRATNAAVPSLFLEFVLFWMLIPQALLPLAALLYASGIIQDEQEDQTITYLLVRPIPKWWLYCIKMAATWTITVLLVLALTIVTFAAIYAGSGADLNEIMFRCAAASAILALAAVAYCSTAASSARSASSRAVRSSSASYTWRLSKACWPASRLACAGEPWFTTHAFSRIARWTSSSPGPAAGKATSRQSHGS
jgi:hypothetical protein